MSLKNKPYHHGDLARTLVETAAAMIEESGPEAVSVREVAKRAEVSPGAPFRHFASREALLAAVAGQAMERLSDAVIAAQALTDSDPLGQIQAIGLAYLSWARANPEHFKVVSQRNLVDLDARAKELNDDIRNRMIGLLAMARETNEMRQDLNPATVLLSCRATVYGLARMYVDGHFPEWQPDGDPTDWMTRSLTLFIQTLRNDPR
ncbi:MAG: TetR/AcrR family transcriptional regulator [Paracoccaceae bacterium]